MDSERTLASDSQSDPIIRPVRTDYQTHPDQDHLGLEVRGGYAVSLFCPVHITPTTSSADRATEDGSEGVSVNRASILPSVFPRRACERNLIV